MIKIKKKLIYNSRSDLIGATPYSHVRMYILCLECCVRFLYVPKQTVVEFQRSVMPALNENLHILKVFT